MKARISLFLTEISFDFLLLIGSLSILAALYSLNLGFQYDRKVSVALQRPKNRFQPHVCLIMPCKGAEPGLAGNIEAALTQQYENCETIIVIDTIDDPACSIATSVIDKHRGSAAKICKRVMLWELPRTILNFLINKDFESDAIR